MFIHVYYIAFSELCQVEIIILFNFYNNQQRNVALLYNIYLCININIYIYNKKNNIYKY